MMNDLLAKLYDQALVIQEGENFVSGNLDPVKFAELIVRECNQAVLEVPLYYKDYRSQIEEATICDCARAVLERFGVEE